jgi:hypothetical protein
MHCMEAEEQFNQAQRTCNRMWHAMRLARQNLSELSARRFASRADLAEALTMIKDTRRKYFEALEALYECERTLRRCGY